MKTYRKLLIMKFYLGIVCLFGLLLPELAGTVVGVILAFRDNGDAFISVWGILGKMLLVVFIYMLIKDGFKTLMEISRVQLPDLEEQPKMTFWVNILVGDALVLLAMATNAFLVFCDINKFLCSLPHSVPFLYLWEEQFVMMFFLERVLCVFWLARYITISMTCNMAADEISDEADLENSN